MKKYYDVTGMEIKKATEKAILFNYGWIPKSQIKNFEIEDITAGGHKMKYEASFIPAWLAIKNNFPYEHTYTLDEMLKRFINTDHANIKEIQ